MTFARPRSRARPHRALHQHELATGLHQRSGQRDQVAERADGARRDLVEQGTQPRLLGPRPQHLDVVSPSSSDLALQPGDATLHRLDQHEVDVRARDREHQTRQTGAAADIADAARAQQRRDDRAVQDVPRPQPREFERADQAQLLAVTRRGSCVNARASVDAVAEERPRRPRLDSTRRRRSRRSRLACFT